MTVKQLRKKDWLLRVSILGSTIMVNLLLSCASFEKRRIYVDETYLMYLTEFDYCYSNKQFVYESQNEIIQNFLRYDSISNSNFYYEEDCKLLLSNLDSNSNIFSLSFKEVINKKLRIHQFIDQNMLHFYWDNSAINETKDIIHRLRALDFSVIKAGYSGGYFLQDLTKEGRLFSYLPISISNSIAINKDSIGVVFNNLYYPEVIKQNIYFDYFSKKSEIELQMSFFKKSIKLKEHFFDIKYLPFLNKKMQNHYCFTSNTDSILLTNDIQKLNNEDYYNNLITVIYNPYFLPEEEVYIVPYERFMFSVDSLNIDFLYLKKINKWWYINSNLAFPKNKNTPNIFWRNSDNVED